LGLGESSQEDEEEEADLGRSLFRRGGGRRLMKGLVSKRGVRLMKGLVLEQGGAD